jgi:hypothetical protein
MSRYIYISKEYYGSEGVLQLDSLQNHVWNLSYDQNSDLNEFKYTKFVHITTLMFSGFMMLYMFRGFQSLQNYNVWMCGPKIMN